MPEQPALDVSCRRIWPDLRVRESGTYLMRRDGLSIQAGNVSRLPDHPGGIMHAAGYVHLGQKEIQPIEACRSPVEGLV